MGAGGAGGLDLLQKSATISTVFRALHSKGGGQIGGLAPAGDRSKEVGAYAILGVAASPAPVQIQHGGVTLPDA